MPSPPFSGPLRKLVVALDVGTTFSGIAYAILDPGEIPKIQNVTRFPGQENGDFKIPSILWYTQEGKVYAAGAEARDSSMELAVEDKNLVFVEWFKLHLRPGSLESEGLSNADLPPLPPGKTVVDVFGDFLAYLFDCTKQFIVETHPNGTSLWNSLGDRIDFVLSHPNGWEGSQQGKMRQAAVRAGLVPNTDAGHSRVHFVTEGEASLHYCIESGLASHVIHDGASVMIVDAGGGTVDLSTYRFVTAKPISVEEISAPDCILQGSTRVNMRAFEFLKAKLRNSRYGNDEDLKAMMDSFEKHTKPTFKGSDERLFIKFGSMRDKDSDFGIRSGQLALEALELTQFFKPCLDGIVQAIRAQRASASAPVNIAFLVGGFAASPWLYSQLKQVLHPMGIDLSRPDHHTNKAVSEGAVSSFLTHSVAYRVSRYTYGAPCSRVYDHYSHGHAARRAQATVLPSGRQTIPNAFQVIMEKDEKVRTAEERRRPFFIEATNSASLDSVCSDISSYRGKTKNPEWTDTEPDCFSTLCTVHADTSRVMKSLQMGPQGAYYTQNFDVVLSCGTTELKAYISWVENGKEQRGDAKIVYDDDVLPV